MLRNSYGRLKVSGKHFALGAAIFIVACLVISPILSPVGCGNARASSCQSNLNQLGKAIKSYLADWNDRYPTNRLNAAGRPLFSNIPLSGPPAGNAHGRRFQNGVDWVEALYPYIERVGDRDDNQTAWCCPSTETGHWPFRHPAEPVTYAFNFNLLERSEIDVPTSANQLMVREMDRKFGAVCRPMNRSTSANARPVGTFLTEYDPELGPAVRCKRMLHASGSNILFADAHVKNFRSALMPTDDKLAWDPQSKQWWNSLDDDTKIVAINP